MGALAVVETNDNPKEHVANLYSIATFFDNPEINLRRYGDECVAAANWIKENQKEQECILFVYHVIPQDTLHFLIPEKELTDTEKQMLANINGYYVHSTKLKMNPQQELDMQYILTAITDSKFRDDNTCFPSNIPLEWRCKWWKYRKDVDEKPLKANIITVYQAGYII